MHTNITFLEIIFRITLFCLLAYKLYELARTYLVPYLFEQISLERKHQTELLEKDKLLLSTRHRIENQLYNQKQTCALLEKKVQVWRKSQQEELLEIEKENRLSMEKLDCKRAIQKKNIALANNLQLSMPTALSSALLELKRRYRTEQGKAILHQVIEDLGSPQKQPVQDK